MSDQDVKLDREVPFFRPSITETEIDEVIACLRSGWLTTGPRCRRLEEALSRYVGSRYAVAVNSCTAAMHLAVEALGLGPGQAVLVPTMTFAATAGVVGYQGAVPVLVDIEPGTLNMDLEDAARKLEELRAGRLPIDGDLPVVGIMPVHVGGLMMDMDRVAEFARAHDLWVVEDAAHALPAAYWSEADDRWRAAGEHTASVTCFSFYANKTVTTGEGGMVVSDDADLIERMRTMSLHGLTHPTWGRGEVEGNWDYRIVAPGFKYNMTDIAAAIGIHQLERAKALRDRREAVAQVYLEQLADVPQIELPAVPENRLHSWHLFPIRLNLDRLRVDRNVFIHGLQQSGVGCAVHWRPIHLHPYYQENFHWQAEQFPVASEQWLRLISLPLFPNITPAEQQLVVDTLHRLCDQYAV